MTTTQTTQAADTIINLNLKLTMDYSIASETADRICIEKGGVFGANDITDNDRYVMIGDKAMTLKQAEQHAKDILTIVEALKKPATHM